MAYVRGDALSGGYWIAASTGHIIALQSSLVGNIGVNSSFLNQSEFDQSQGYTYEQITSGAYKDADSVDKPLTDANRAFIQGVTNDLFAVFSSVVMKGRNMTAQQFSAVSDGRYYVASKGLQLGLIDEIGDISQVENYVATKTGTNINNLQLCDFPG